MRIALISPPYTHKIFSENLSTVDEEFCIAPPIILAYVASIIEKHGHRVRLIDARALNLSKEDVLNELRLFKPDILGFRAETYHFHDALEWIRYLKDNLGIPVLAGGVNLSLYPKETLSHPEIDYGIAGECIDNLPRLLSALEYGDTMTNIPELVYKKDGLVIANPSSETVVNFDNYPFPARHLLPNEAYYSFISQLKNFTIMVTSTGCPFRCSFCAIHPNTKYRTRSPKNVVDEIELCYKEFNVREIDFFDATFFIDKPRMSEIFNEIKKRRLNIEWSCRTRVDVVDKNILRQAAGAGCRQIYYGIESVESDVLELIKKDVKLDQVKEAIKCSKKYGIRTMGFFMVGNPGDTKNSIRKTMGFAKSLGLDFIQVCRTIAKPGTELDKIMIEKTKRDFWREHVSGKKIEGRLPTPWSNLSEIEIEALTKEFYTKFYFRPRIILDRIRQLRSFEEFRRYIKVGRNILLQKSELYHRILTDTSESEKVLRESEIYLKEARRTRVAIIIPTYNEKENIRDIVLLIREILPGAYVVIVDDNSSDGTVDVIRDLVESNGFIRVISREGERGLGLSYVAGFKYALETLNVKYIIEMDADFSHNPNYLPIFLKYAKEYDIVTGSRFLKRVSIRNRTSWRNVISITTKWFVNKLLATNLTDATTGFKCFHRRVLENIELDKVESKGYAFQIEMSFLAKNKGYAIKELPILFTERSRGKSKMSLKIMFEGLCLVLRLALRRYLKGGIKHGCDIHRKQE
ncbi:glycosyltransferase [Candidatus Omnitrophota bacterium]